MYRRLLPVFLTVLLVFLMAGIASAQQDQKLTITGVDYTKWLWGNQRTDGAMYNFTTVPGEGYGDNGQGTEIELLLSAKPSKYVEVNGRIHSRFNQNFWTNFGGFGDPAGKPGGDPACTGGDCGENDPRSNQYVKLRGLTVRITPGYKYVDAVQIGASDWGMFDPFTIGKIRYIDRDNGAGLLVQGTFPGRKVSYDAARISLPRLWAGPGWSTGNYNVQDAAYGLQFRANVNPKFDGGLILEHTSDAEIRGTDNNWDNGRELDSRFKNSVVGIKGGFHVSPMVDIRAAAYHSTAEANPMYTDRYFGINGYSPTLGGKHDDESYKLNLDLIDPFHMGLSFNLEYFDIGAEYESMMAARRESDVLLTEGHDATFAFPGPANASYGVFGGNATRIGYGGWQGTAQQVATVNVDNDFTDFDEPMAETVIGWKGVTIVPTWKHGNLDLAGEVSYITYNTNWQAWGDPTRSITSTEFPAAELDTGVGHNFRSPYAPFQDKRTDIALIRGKYLVDIGKGIDVFGKIKFLNETDKRMNDAKYLPFAAGACPGNGVACTDTKNFYAPGLSTGDYFGNPPVITVDGVTGYQWKPFDSLSDDNRDLNYTMVQLGAGYQFTDLLYGSASFERYMADLKDGNTAFQAYNLHEMASGQHDKNNLILLAKYNLGGAEFGFNYEYSFGTFDPDFGTGFVPQHASQAVADQVHVKVGSLGFANRYNGWNSLETRNFDQQRFKAYMKVRF